MFPPKYFAVKFFPKRYFPPGLAELLRIVVEGTYTLLTKSSQESVLEDSINEALVTDSDTKSF